MTLNARINVLKCIFISIATWSSYFVFLEASKREGYSPHGPPKSTTGLYLSVYAHLCASVSVICLCLYLYQCACVCVCSCNYLFACADTNVWQYMYRILQTKNCTLESHASVLQLSPAFITVMLQRKALTEIQRGRLQN